MDDERRKKKIGGYLRERAWSAMAGLGIAVLMGVLIWSLIFQRSHRMCPMPISPEPRRRAHVPDSVPTTTLLRALLHYATSTHVPQQSLPEITLAFHVLMSMGRPSNVLVFGLGHDSLMWDCFNPEGTTLFLEEDPKWVQMVLKDAPRLRAHTVQYQTRLRQAGPLLSSYRSEPACSPSNVYLRGNQQCRLALGNLPDEVYDKEWDLIMIDTPGRMAAIFSAAVIARNRKSSGVTHVFLHDVDRKAVKVYANEFLCTYNLVNSVGKLWHFEIPRANAPNHPHRPPPTRFC